MSKFSLIYNPLENSLKSSAKNYPGNVEQGLKLKANFRIIIFLKVVQESMPKVACMISVICYQSILVKVP